VDKPNSVDRSFLRDRLAIIYLTRLAPSVPAARLPEGDYYPRLWSFPLSRADHGQATLSSALSCTSWGFSCDFAYVKSGGLLPRLFTLITPEFFRVQADGLFSVTLSVAQGLGPKRPRFIRGMLPFGVRTFLWSDSRQPSDRLHGQRLVPLRHNVKSETSPAIMG
jgi:hypothetical protein